MPAYTGSYNRALVTINDVLSKNKDTELILDLHRDALGSNSSYGPSVQIGEEKCAQLMFVIGTDDHYFILKERRCRIMNIFFDKELAESVAKHGFIILKLL